MDVLLCVLGALMVTCLIVAFTRAFLPLPLDYLIGIPLGGANGYFWGWVYHQISGR